MVTFDVVNLTASEVLLGLETDQFTSRAIVEAYLAQISKSNEHLRAVLETAPTALSEASRRDCERTEGISRGPLHRLPILLKGNIATHPKLQMDTISRNLALCGSRPKQNAFVVQKLLNAGAIILGKASMSELSYWKIHKIPAGWSPVGRQGQNPYVRGGRRSGDPVFSFSGPGGSSSGPSIGVAAGFAPAAVGTETSGSLIFPSDRAALYTIKPTAGIISARGIVPVSYRFDTAGPMAKCSRDVALLLDVLVDAEKTQIPPGGYVSVAMSMTSWSGLKVGVLDVAPWLYGDAVVKYAEGSKEQIVREVLAAYEAVETKAKALRRVELESCADSTSLAQGCDPLIGQLFEYDYKRDFEQYLGTLETCCLKGLHDVLDDNDTYKALALPDGQHGREALSRAISSPITSEEAAAAEKKLHQLSRKHGIDGALRIYDVDVLLGPGNGPLYKICAAAGYPIATLPLSYLETNGCPFGLVAMAGAHQEALLVQVQAAWESIAPKRRAPPEVSV